MRVVSLAGGRKVEFCTRLVILSRLLEFDFLLNCVVVLSLPFAGSCNKKFRRGKYIYKTDQETNQPQQWQSW